MVNHKERKALFKELSSHRERSLITLINSTKKPEALFATQIAQDIIPVFYEILRGIPNPKKLDLLIYSAGGQVDTPWPLVNLIREYFEDFNVIVPWRAHSAATLIALGANNIGMGPLGSLSPIDPQFRLKRDDQTDIEASVEDVEGFYRLLSERLDLDQQGRAEALKLLSNRIHPEILGKVSRQRREIFIISRNLLSLHMQNEEKIENIAHTLTVDLPSHHYLISRKEANELDLPVEYLDMKTEELSMLILNSYIKDCKMDEPGLTVDFGTEPIKRVTLNRAFIENETRSYIFPSEYTIHKDGKLEKKGEVWKEVTSR